jgi:hypothetical protein
MGTKKWEIRNKKLLFISYLLLLAFIAACGRRGDPIVIAPYKEVGVVKDFKALKRDGNIYLTWRIPEGEDFFKEALKGFVVFRAEIPEGVTVKECECSFRLLDFIGPDSKSSRYFGIDSEKTFEYLDKKVIRGQAYVYKIVVMDKNNKTGKDSNIVLVKDIEPEPEKVVTIPPKVPTGLVAIYTQKSIILTWDEIRGQEIKFYNVYRSEGKDFAAIGETVTFAFTDKDIEPSRKYYYRVTVVGDIEGPPSEEIEIVTEIH